MSDEAPKVYVDPNSFEPHEFARVLVTRMLTNTTDSWCEVGDIAYYERKGDLAFHAIGLATQMVELLATQIGASALVLWQDLLRSDAECREERKPDA